MLRKEHDLNKKMHRQLAQWVFKGCDNEYSELQHITVKQGDIDIPGFTMTGEEIDIITKELRDYKIMSFSTSDGATLNKEEMRLRFLQQISNLFFHEYEGRQIGSKGRKDNYGNNLDFSTVKLTYIHPSFTKEEVHNIVHNNTETNPDWRVGKTLTQKGQAVKEPIHDIKLRFHSEKWNNKTKKWYTTHYCRCGNCGSMAHGGKYKGFCKRHSNIHGKDYSDEFPFPAL